jgi:hypothetical protein
VAPNNCQPAVSISQMLSYSNMEYGVIYILPADLLVTLGRCFFLFLVITLSKEILRDAGLVFLAAYLFRYPSTKFSLDKNQVTHNSQEDVE